jgi:Fur family ferric uptake transcriptional regulator
MQIYEVKPRRDHIHLTCLQCGGVQEFSTPLFEELKNVITQQMGFDIALTRLDVGEACAACRGKTQRLGRCAGEQKAPRRR